MSYTVKQIAGLLGLEFQGDGTRLLKRVARLDAADDCSLVFSEKTGSLQSTGCKAACVIAPSDNAPPEITTIYSKNPKLDFSRAAAYLHPNPVSRGTRHHTAVIDPNSEIGDNVEIGPFVLVSAGSRIGAGSILHAGVIIGEGCRIGNESILYPGVTLYPGAHIGDRVVLHAGVVIGSDGYGYVFQDGRYVKFPQVGEVIIDDDVEIGCNTTVDRGSLGVTRIGVGSKIDNLVQIAHNVQIGRHVIIAAQTGISGSTIIEDHAVIGGQVGFGDHVRVQQGAVIGSKAGVLPGKIVRGGETYWGVPIRPLKEYKRLNAHFGRLPEMKADIDVLKKEIERLKSLLSNNDQK
jgi:UDP-3-O-[3-hydroxymyristoyl] glucosamine N-acyltransferase